MNVGKNPKKPLIYYYSIVILVLAIINLILVPTITSSKIEEVDYSTFMQMTEEKQINEVQINNNILFSYILIIPPSDTNVPNLSVTDIFIVVFSSL